MSRNQFPSTQRCKAWGRITILFALIALAITALPTASFAGTDTAGNVLATEVDSRLHRRRRRSSGGTHHRHCQDYG